MQKIWNWKSIYNNPRPWKINGAERVFWNDDLCSFTKILYFMDINIEIEMDSFMRQFAKHELHKPYKSLNPFHWRFSHFYTLVGNQHRIAANYDNDQLESFPLFAWDQLVFLFGYSK